MLSIRPISRNAANAWLAEYHRHLRREVTGWLFGVEVLSDGVRVGVACAGRPKARMLQDGVTCEVTRVCTDGTPNACSKAYGALRRAAVALGYQRIYTYTTGDETGASVRAAGFVADGDSRGGQWTRLSRPRGQTEDPSPKQRWVWPPSARSAT